MDWTKIMNKKWLTNTGRKRNANKTSKNRKQKKEENQEEEQERIRQKLRLHVKELTEEMNLRLVLDLQSEVEKGNLPEEMWMWVDSIRVVYMEFPQKRKRLFFRLFREIRNKVRKAGKLYYSRFFR